MMTSRAHGFASTIAFSRRSRATSFVLRRPRLRIDRKLAGERNRRDAEETSQHEKHRPPAKPIAEHAAGGLTEQLPGDLAREIARQHLLPTRVGDDIADVRHPHWDDPGRERRRCDPRDRQRRQALGHTAQRDEHTGAGAGDHDHRIFAEPVADWSDEELHRAVHERIGPHGDGCDADRHREVLRNLRQQRIGRAHHRLAREASDREQHDGAGVGRLCGWGRWRHRQFFLHSCSAQRRLALTPPGTHNQSYKPAGRLPRPSAAREPCGTLTACDHQGF